MPTDREPEPIDLYEGEYIAEPCVLCGGPCQDI